MLGQGFGIFVSCWRVSSGIFQSSYQLGVLFRTYAAAETISGHNSSGRLAWILIALALEIITPLEYSAEPFCSGV